MTTAFFPDPVFAWVFCVGLFLLTCVAAWIDTRTTRIPNRLTLVILGLGVVMSAIRGGWLGADDKPVWLWVSNPGPAWLGVIDGLLFAFVGFLVAFVVMFVFWIFGTCGGGDVKLVGAVGAWLGVTKALLWLWLFSAAVLFVWMSARVLSGGLSPTNFKRTRDQMKKAREGHKDGSPKQPGPLRVTYSLPIAVATAVVLLWMFRFELGLVPPKPQPVQQGTAAHARPSPRPA